MNLYRFIILSITTLLIVVVAGAGVGVGQDAYPVEALTVSPSTSGCVGDSVVMSAGGAPANTAITVSMNPDAGGATVSGVLATTMSDALGNWTATGTIPAKLDNMSVVPGTYVIWAMDGASYRASSTFSVFNCTALPSTGSDLPIAALALLGAGLLVTGLGYRLIRR